MIKKYIYNSPYFTNAVIENVEEGKKQSRFKEAETEKGLSFTCPLFETDIVYGLGENMRGINKRGGEYISFNTDEPNHLENTKSLYASHNFFVVDGQQKFGAFFDVPSKVVFKIDCAASGEIEVVVEKPDLTLYIIDGVSAYDITKQFLSIIGQSYLPPLWAFGYGQSRWGYKNERDFDAVADGYAKIGVPLDYICMDIDYMDRYIDFTVNKTRFPDLKQYAEKLKKKGVRLVPIIDAGVKVEPGNEVYDEGVKNGFFCKNLKGDYFHAAVWPGMTHFPDFFRKDAREWFGSKYKAITDLGIEGFWNDMNEPSIFYSECSKKQNLLDLALNTFFPKRAEDKPKSSDDYRQFTHSIDGKTVLHYDVHNLYGAFMTMASGEGLNKLLDKRFMLFSRSSYIGAHRYGGIWTGDNSSTWEMLRQNVYHMPALNMCGFLFSGADTGGFGKNTTRELLLRWLAFSVFTPLFRNHSALMTKNQECYRFKKPEDFKSIIDLRYRLLPYIYSEYMKAALKKDMFIKPLSFGFDGDEAARAVEDQLLVGESVMIAPIVHKGEKSRKVYLPEDMTEIRYRNNDFSSAPASRGRREISVELNEVVFYIRKDCLVPIAKQAKNTSECDLADVLLLGDGTSYKQYLDDGFTKNCSADSIRTLTR